MKSSPTPRPNNHVAKAAFALAMATASIGLADTHYWAWHGTGSWEDRNWASYQGGINNMINPTNGDVADLTCSWDATAWLHGRTTYTAPGLSTVYVSGTGGATVTVKHDAANQMYIGGDEFIGYDPGSRAAYNQSGGGNTVIGSLWVAYNPNTIGTYTLSGNTSTLSAGALVVGDDSQANGTFDHQSGAVNVTNTVALGSYNALANGTYKLSGGTLSATSLVVGDLGLANFTHSVGRVSLSSLIIGQGSLSSGSYALSSGTLTAITETIGQSGQGAFNQTGGVNNCTGTIALGAQAYLTAETYQLNAPGAVNAGTMLLGNAYGATGVFYQNSGSVNVTNVLSLGAFGQYMSPRSFGTYSIYSGTLSTGSLIVGDLAYGTFSQSGGNVSTTADLIIGNGTDGYECSGIYSIFSGSLNVGRDLYVGGGANFGLAYGTLNLSSNTASINVAGAIVVGKSNGTITQNAGNITATSLSVGTRSQGSYFLSGSGSLNITNLTLVGGGGGSGTFTQTGGWHTCGGLTIDAGGLYTLNGGTLTAATIDVRGDPSRLIFQSGTIDVTNAQIILGTGTPFGTALQLRPKTTLRTAASIMIGTGAALQMSGGLLIAGLDMENLGQVQMASPQATIQATSLSNYSVITGSGRIESSLTNQSGATVLVGFGDHLTVTGMNSSNHGGSMQLSGGTIEFTWPISNDNAGTISGRGSLVVPNLVNTSSIVFTGGQADLYGVLQNTLGGTVLITNGSQGTFHGDVHNFSGSTFNVSSLNSASFLGSVTGLDSFTGAGYKIFYGSASGGALKTTGGTMVETGGSLSVASIREDWLVLRGPAKVLANGADSAFSRLGTLTIESGSLDLCDNDLILDDMNLETVRGYLAASFNNGSWNGYALGSSSARTQSTSLHRTALRYAGASSIGVSTFDGQPVAGASVLIRYTYSGDANLDGKVNALDFNALASNFGSSGKTWSQGDYNYDGMINTLDFNVMASNFGLLLPSQPMAMIVPEPMFVGAALLIPLLVRRHRVRRSWHEGPV